MSATFEMHCEQINERTPLVSEVEWLSHDHLRQGESAQSGPKQVADCLAPSSPTEWIESAPKTGQLVREFAQVLFEPRFAAGACGDKDLERCKRGRIAECVPAGVHHGLHALAQRPDR